MNMTNRLGKVSTKTLACAMFLCIAAALAQNATPPAAQPATPPAHAPLPPLPAAMSIPKPGPQTDQPYAPQPLLQGGIVIPLYAPNSKFLDKGRAHIREPEQYSMSADVPGRVTNVVNIHNPSIEVHLVEGTLNTGAVVILAPGGGHNTLVVGTEGVDFVPFFANYGINAVILRNRLRKDGYDPKTDEVYDAQQAIRMVRAYAKQFKFDPNKIGIMGFSAGAELAAPAAISFDTFDQANNDPADPFAGISSRPDFAGIIYPGPSPFTRGATPPIPHNVPPSFIACAGSGDQGHAIWADEYFSAMLAVSAPNLEMHIYAVGHHPGSGSTGGLTDRLNTPYGTWQYRFIDWFRDLGFMQKPGIETQAARDVAAYAKNPPRPARRPAPAPVPGNAPGATPPAAPPANP